MKAKRILSVGQCAADHAALTRAISQSFGAEVVPADSGAEALERLQAEPFILVLVNRVLDADGSSGLEVIRQLRAEVGHVPAMLVSNYEDSQRQAVQLGALPGFGKAALGQPRMLACLRDVLG